MVMGCQGYTWLGNNFINIEGNGIIRTITIIKHLDNNIKRPKVLFWYDFVNGIIDEEEDVLLVPKFDLFTIGTIILLEPKILVKVVVNAKISIDAKIGINPKTNIDAKIDTNTKIGTDMKIDIDEPIFYFPRTPSKILVDTTPTRSKTWRWQSGIYQKKSKFAHWIWVLTTNHKWWSWTLIWILLWQM